MARLLRTATFKSYKIQENETPKNKWKVAFHNAEAESNRNRKTDFEHLDVSGRL